MFPYYLLILFPFLAEAIESILHPSQGNAFTVRRSNNSIIIFFAIWCVMLSLRSLRCGTDLYNYEFFFNTTLKLNFVDIFKVYPIEQLYYVFNWCIAQIYPDFRLFLVITSCICAGITGWFYWKESEFAPLTILFFITNACFTMFYSGLRQSLATLFAIPAYYLTKRKKIIPFILIVALATYFHTSAIILFLLFPIYHIPLRSRFFVIVLILVAFFFLFNANIFQTVLPFWGERYVDRYGMIQETNGYSVWLLFVFLLSFSFLVLDENKITGEISGLRNVLVLMTLIQGFAPIHTLAMRMNYYFIMLFPIIIPKFLNRPKEGWENIAQFTKWGLVIFLTFFFFYEIHFTENILRVWPYVAYWE